MKNILHFLKLCIKLKLGYNLNFQLAANVVIVFTVLINLKQTKVYYKETK